LIKKNCDLEEVSGTDLDMKTGISKKNVK